MPRQGIWAFPKDGENPSTVSKEKSDLIRLVSPQYRKVIELQCGNGLDGAKPKPESS